MKIVADENIPFVHELFSPYGEVIVAPGRQMDSELLKNADALIVRSVTKVNELLLSQSNVKFVGTCTIGSDHLDKGYLDSAGIEYANAPGCNANGVVQYVIAALVELSFFDFDKTVGIVGFGNVGSRLYRQLMKLGFDCKVYDPFKTETDCKDLVEFNQILGCDIISVHTPLTSDGAFPTKKMFSTEQFNQIKENVLLLNAGRGPVFDNQALVDHLTTHPKLNVVLDVWQEEPNINQNLFDLVRLGTPHIAGYSYEGKINGSTMIYEAFCKFLGVSQCAVQENLEWVLMRALGEKQPIQTHTVLEAIKQVYDIRQDYIALKNAKSTLPGSFDLLRKNYYKRREFSHYLHEQSGDQDTQLLSALGFTVVG